MLSFLAPLYFSKCLVSSTWYSNSTVQPQIRLAFTVSFDWKRRCSFFEPLFSFENGWLLNFSKKFFPRGLLKGLSQWELVKGLFSTPIRSSSFAVLWKLNIRYLGLYFWWLATITGTPRPPVRDRARTPVITIRLPLIRRWQSEW